MALYLPLIYVRKIQKFAVTHIFSDMLILLSILVLCIYAGVDVGKRGGFAPDCIQAITSFWPSAIGFSMYAFEGIGVILPIREITEKKEDYLKIFTLVVGGIGIFYLIFCEFMIFGYGEAKVQHPLITEALPRKSIVTYGIKVLFCIMLLFTYPLQMYPANIVIESYLVPGWPKSRKRQMVKNISRTLVVAASCLLAISVYDKLEKLLAVVGALTCCPMAFTLPSLCHYKLIAKTQT